MAYGIQYIDDGSWISNPYQTYISDVMKIRRFSVSELAQEYINQHFGGSTRYRVSPIEGSMRWEGYVPQKYFPFKIGDRVTILKGTPIWHRGEWRYAKRTYKITIRIIMNGINATDFMKSTGKNPSITFAGTGGYWSDVDINLIPEANL